MIDIHCHILPRLDDGAFSLDESVLMAEGAFECGTRGIVCTPHSGPYSAEELVSAFVELKNTLRSLAIPIELYLGQEIYLTDALMLLNETETVCGFEVEAHRYDIGNKLEFLKATVEFGLRHADGGEKTERTIIFKGRHLPPLKFILYYFFFILYSFNTLCIWSLVAVKQRAVCRFTVGEGLCALPQTARVEPLPYIGWFNRRGGPLCPPAIDKGGFDRFAISSPVGR